MPEFPVSELFVLRTDFDEGICLFHIIYSCHLRQDNTKQNHFIKKLYEGMCLTCAVKNSLFQLDVNI